MTWGVSTARRRPGELLTRGDVCHLHADRDGAERSGAAAPGAPDLVRLEQYSERVYRVLWSLSDTSGGELRGPTAGPARSNVKEAVDCYFDDTMPRPKLIRLHFVRDEILVA